MYKLRVRCTLFVPARLAVLALLLSALAPSSTGAAPEYLIRTIQVAEDPLVPAIDQPSDSILVPAGYPDQYGQYFNAISALTILNGRTGKVERTIAPPVGYYLTLPVVAPSVDGSGRVYFTVNGASGLKTLLPGGVLRPAGFALPGYYASARVVVDRQRDRLVMLGASPGLTGYLLSTGRQVYTVPIVAPYAFLFDQPGDALYVTDNNGLTKREVRAGHLLAQAVLGPVSRLILLRSQHQLVTLSTDPENPNLNKVGILDARTLKVLASTDFGPLEDYSMNGSDIPGSWQPLAVDAGAGRVVVLVVALENGDNPSATPPGWALLIDLHSGRVVHTVKLTGSSPWAVAVDSALHRAFIISLDTTTLSVVDTRSGALVATVRVGARPASVIVDERDQTVFVANSYSAGSSPTGTVTMFDAHITGNHG